MTRTFLFRKPWASGFNVLHLLLVSAGNRRCGKSSRITQNGLLPVVLRPITVLD